MLVSAVALAKACQLMLLTLAGMLMLVSAVAPANALSPITTTPAGMVYEAPRFPAGYLSKNINPYPFSNKTPAAELYLVFAPSTVMRVSAVAPSNASVLIPVTLSGMVILVSAVAPANALSPMLATPSGITTAPAHEPPKVISPSRTLYVGAPVVVSAPVEHK